MFECAAYVRTYVCERAKIKSLPKVPPFDKSFRQSYLHQCLTKMYCKMVLKINESSDNIISEWMMTQMSEYLKFIAKKLDCAIDELCYLDVHPDFEDLDEEGWNINSFFPERTKFAIGTLHDDMNGKIAIEIPNFSIGVVKEVVVNGKLFYADYNASPIEMITKREGLW